MTTIENGAEIRLLDDAELDTACGGSIVDTVVQAVADVANAIGSLVGHRETAKGMI